MKRMSITELRSTPVKELLRIMRREDIRVTRYGKAVAVIRPVPKEFQTRTIEEYLAELHRRKKAVEEINRVKKKIKKPKLDTDWWEEIKAEELRAEEEKWARIFPEGESKIVDVAREMTRDLRKVGVMVDVSRKHGKNLAGDIESRKVGGLKPGRGKSKTTFTPRRKR